MRVGSSYRIRLYVFDESYGRVRKLSEARIVERLELEVATQEVNVFQSRRILGVDVDQRYDILLRYISGRISDAIDGRKRRLY